MQKAVLIFAAALALAGCSTTQERSTATATQVVVSTPQPVERARVASQATSQTEMLTPGANYMASFPEADRRAACDRLNYKSGTQAYSKCLEGNFPENPYFAQR